MTNTIFDILDEDIPEGKEGYFKIAENDNKYPGYLDTFLQQLKTTAPVKYGSSALKGGIEGVSKLGRVMGPLEGQSISSEKQREVLDQLIPESESQSSQPGTFDSLLKQTSELGPRAARRGISEIPTVASFPGGKQAELATRSLLAGFVGESAKELGAPEWAQTALEITTFIGPDITKKLLESGKNAEIIKAAKELGLSDEAIAPLIQSDFKQKWLSKLTPRRGKTEEVLKKSKSELESSYGKIQQSDAAKLQLKDSSKLQSAIESKLSEMPSSVREKIATDFKDLLSKPITGESLINFYVDVNHELGPKTKQLVNLKQPIKEALKEIDPALAKNFDTINDLYSKYYKIAEKLKPNLMTDIIGAGESLAILASIVTGNAPILLKFGGEAVFRRLAREMLTNPRYQQLSQKTVEALNTGKYGAVKKLSDAISFEVRKTSPELANKLDELTVEEFKELLHVGQKNKD